jgi:hypothetical protein
MGGGWTPVRWQGWFATIIYVFLLVLFSLTIDKNSPNNENFLAFLLPAVLFTVILVQICYKTGESPRWQWGAKKR